jgi:hypothetical protein
VSELERAQDSAGSVPGYAPVLLPGFATSPTSLVVETDMSFEAFQEVFERLNYLAGAVNWWLGDLLLWGERKFGDSCYQVADPCEAQRLQKARWVAERVKPRQRRSELSWSHHRAVASLDDPREQERWLNFAQVEGLRSGELEREMRRIRTRPDGEEHAPDDTQVPRCPDCNRVLEEAWLKKQLLLLRKRRQREPDLARTKIDGAYYADQTRLEVEEEAT